MEPNKVMSSSLDEIVFEHRNKSYGAYLLRMLYPTHLKKASAAALLLFVIAISTPLIAKLVGGTDVKDKEVVVVVDLEAPPIDPNKPPPPPPPPPPKYEPPPPKASVKYVPPKVVVDKDVVEEEPPPKVEEMKEVQVSTKTVEGAKGGVPVITDTEGDGPPVEVRKEPEVFTRVEQMPQFPDGEAAMMRWLSENIKYPAIARENNIEGTVVVQFVVDEKGNIYGANVLRGIGGGCNEEALRVVKKMPKWKPGRQQGREVRVKFTLPIRFKLQ